MRRKFISALLFGALVTASTSTFVSCKDYDDDINGLQGQITTNASTLEEMVNEKVSNLTTEINTLKDQDAALTQALDQAKADLNAAIEEAKTAASDAEAAAKAYADVQAEAARVAAIEAAKQSIADAQAQLQAGIDAATQKLEEISGQVSTHETQIAGLLDADKELQDAIIAANGKIDAAQTTANDALASAQEANDKLAQVVENLTTVKGELDSQISLLGDKVDQAVADIAANKAEVDADIAEANSLIQSNADAIAALQGKDTELGKLIEANTNELTALKGQLESLQSALDANLESAKAYTDAQIEGLKSALGIPVEDIKTNFEDIQGRLGKAEEQLAKIVEALKSDDGSIGSISSSIASLREDLTELTEQVATNLETTNQKIGELEGDIEEINGKLATNTTNISDLQERVSTLESQIGQWAEGIGTVAENVKLMQDNIKAHSDELARLAGVSKLLKGLVFNPEKYYQGIEAIGIESFNYHAIIAGLQTPNLDDDQTDDKATRLASTETSVVPIVEASYWMNPSNATVDTVTANVKKHFSFIVNNAEYTRAAQESDIVVDSARFDKDERGLLNVFFSMKNANNIAKIPATGNGNVDVMALRYNYSTENSDTTIMSDFAALKQYKIENFYINKANNGNAGAPTAQSGENHLALTAAAAVSHNSNGEYSAPTLEIAYNKTEGIDLDEWINVHYDINGETDKYWGDQDEINKKKFKLVYELIGYKANDADKTNESQHATISSDNVLTVHDVNGETGSRKIIGRTPLVRVTLVDVNTNEQVAAVGYIVVKITDVSSEPIKVDDIGAIDNGYTVICDDNVALNNVKAITWQEVEDKVLGELNMSKEEFESNYSLEVVNGTKNAKQYSYDGSDNSFAEMTDRIGEIVNTEDELGHTTNILTWTVRNQEAYQLFVRENKSEVSVYVKFAPRNTVSTQRDVYVKLTWAPSAVNKTPEATILDAVEHKSKADWHATNSREEGWKELHVQVGSATVAGATCEYENLTVAKTFNKQPIDIIKDDLGSTYAALANAANVTYKFADRNKQTKTQYVTSNTTYNITVSPDGSTISAAGSTLATINPADGKITIAKNDVSKAIINSYGKNDLANALTLTVEIVPSTCSPANEDDLIVLNNNKLDVKVIKPIFVTDTAVEDMELNNASTLTRDVFLSFEDFNGYDPQTFWDNSMDKVEFWKFYGVTSIKCDESKIETNYTGQWTSVDPSVFTIDYTEPVGDIKLNNMGKVTLTQVNMSRANSFDVRVPLTITYSWGTLTANVTVHVKAAPGMSTIKRH